MYLHIKEGMQKHTIKCLYIYILSDMQTHGCIYLDIQKTHALAHTNLCAHPDIQTHSTQTYVCT